MGEQPEQLPSNPDQLSNDTNELPEVQSSQVKSQHRSNKQLTVLLFVLFLFSLSLAVLFYLQSASLSKKISDQSNLPLPTPTQEPNNTSIVLTDLVYNDANISFGYPQDLYPLQLKKGAFYFFRNRLESEQYVECTKEISNELRKKCEGWIYSVNIVFDNKSYIESKASLMGAYTDTMGRKWVTDGPVVGVEGVALYTVEHQVGGKYLGVAFYINEDSFSNFIGRPLVTNLSDGTTDYTAENDEFKKLSHLILNSVKFIDDKSAYSISQIKDACIKMQTTSKYWDDKYLECNEGQATRKVFIDYCSKYGGNYVALADSCRHALEEGLPCGGPAETYYCGFSK